MSFPLLSFLFIGFSLSFSPSFVCGCLAFGLRLSVLSVLPSSLSRVWLPFGDQTFSEYLHYSVQGLFFSPFGGLGLFRPLPPSLGFCYTHQFASTRGLRLPTQQTHYTRMHPPA